MGGDRLALCWGRRHADVVVAWEPVNEPVLAWLERAHSPIRTASFTVLRDRATTLVVHRLDRDAVDNDIGELIANELVRPGLIHGPDAFERCFAGLVESTAASPREGWRRFYANTLRGLGDAKGSGRGGPVATFSRIYAHAGDLVRGPRLLDTGSCFAFFPMLLAARRERRVTASDRHPATVALGAQMAGELALAVSFRIADVTGPLPFPDDSFETITALHLIEHLPSRSNQRVLAGFCRVARRRVIVAVPIEEVPDPVYGHRQTFDLASLEALTSAVSGWRGVVHEHLGGWLVLDRRPGPPTRARGWLKHP